MVKIMSPADVLDIIKQLGTTMTKQTLTSKTYTPGTGAVAEVGGSTETAYATPPMPYVRSMGDGSTVERSVMMTYIAAKDLSVAPIKGYELTFDSIVWKIVSVDTLTDDGVAILYMCEVAKP